MRDLKTPQGSFLAEFLLSCLHVRENLCPYSVRVLFWPETTRGHQFMDGNGEPPSRLAAVTGGGYMPLKLSRRPCSLREAPELGGGVDDGGTDKNGQQ
jgi:hypothetical protein